jgi:monofunctional glycosyltransferase
VPNVPSEQSGERAASAGVHPLPRSGRRTRDVLYRVGKVLLLLLGAYYVFAVLMLIVFRFVPPPVTAVQLQRRVEAVASREYSVEKSYRPLASLPRHVPRAVVAAEDGRFYDHAGFDLQEMRAAASDAVGGGRLRGASTITQQLVKNLFGCACRNPLRKVYDLTLTPPAELILGKDRILELYLNNVEWGEGVFGIEAAARHHYGVAAEGLSRTQAAGLAALLPNPRARTPANTGAYRASILGRMSQRGW